MGTERAPSVDASATDTGRRQVDPVEPGPALAAGGLGERRIQAAGLSRLGAVDDPAERAADAAADQVMRMVPVADPVPPSRPPTPSAEPVRRVVDPAVEHRPPSLVTPKPARPAGGASGGPRPDTATFVGVPGPVAPPAPEPAADEGDTSGTGAPVVPDAVQEYLDASRGGGAPLPAATRDMFETAYRRPLDDVRIHDDGAADAAARSIEALAFTRGTDIYFRAGAYDPVSRAGKRLLAHELAHVVQQVSDVKRSTTGASPGFVGRSKETKKIEEKSTAGHDVRWVNPSNKSEHIDISNPEKKTLTLDGLAVPKFKESFFKGRIQWRRNSEKRQDGQRATWLTNSGIVTDARASLRERLTEDDLGVHGPYRLQGRAEVKASNYLYMGEADAIAALLVIPPWNREGKHRIWEVDHRHEWQVHGEDNVENLWLLTPKLNRESGAFIRAGIERQINGFLEQANPHLVRPIRGGAGALKSSSWTVTWNRAVGVGESTAPPTEHWERSDVKDPGFMIGLERLQEGGNTGNRLRGTPSQLAIYRDSIGGLVVPVSIDKASGTKKLSVGGGTDFVVTWTHRHQGKIAPNDLQTPASGSVGLVVGDAIRKDKQGKVVRALVGALKFPIMGIPGVEWGGWLDITSLRAERKRLLDMPATSPVDLNELDFDLESGLTARGRVPKPTLKLLERTEIAVVIDKGEIGVDATITGDALNLPGPLKVQGGALTLSATTGGLGIDGRIDFEIEKLATGFIAGGAAGKAGQVDFALEGGLHFDRKMFSKADLGLSYRAGRWTVSGELGIGPDKVAGIRSVSAKVLVSDETITADGTFETSLKGVDKGTLGFRYNPETGMEISGEVLLGRGIPGIRGGKMAATIKQLADGGWSLAGDVTAEPAVPGLSGAITGSYADGAFDVHADLAYERGGAKGVVKAGLTNRKLGADGLPTGPVAKDGALSAYGGGMVTLAITPWLQGTVGLRLTPQGEIEVIGQVALPEQFDVFGEKAVERTVAAIGIDLPIVGVAVAGQRIGIFATIKGGITARAGFGPGQLRNVRLAVTYNPERPDDTHVTGGGTFVVPARAGLRLQVDGGLGAGIPVVSATAGVSMYGEVGLSGAASAATAIDWTPRTGIVLDARGEVFVEPRFRFGVDAFVDVTADLLLTEYELYRRTWKLAALEYGSTMRFGLAFPMHYESGQPFDLSYDQIQWTIPQIDPMDLLGGLMKQLVG